jgi:hypothetical protein
LATTTNRYLCYPSLATGPTLTTGTSAWVNTAWTQLVPASGITADFYIAALATLIFPTATVATKYQTDFGIGIGGIGSEVEKIVIPLTWYIHTAVGHAPTTWLVLPEPMFVAANSRVSIRCATSAAAAQTFGPFKIMYQTA